MTYHKISIVTPNFNGGKYLEETIKSVIFQKYPNLEYIIIDGGSTDNSIEIIKKYTNYLSFWISEPDTGMYDGLSKGFAKSSGEIMGWLNSDDLLHANSLFTINELFQLSKVKWVEGIPSTIDELGRTIAVSQFRKWSKYGFWSENYEWIQQESTYWHRALWDKAGGYIDKSLKYAGDFELWNRFFYFEKIYAVHALIGGFRIRSKNQLSLDFIDAYHIEARNTLKSNIYSNKTLGTFRKIKKMKRVLRVISKTRILNLFAFIHRIENKIEKLYDYPEEIYFDRHFQKFYTKSSKAS